MGRVWWVRFGLFSKRASVITTTGIIALLGACGHRGEAVGQRLVVPLAVQHAMSASFPDDGMVHVLAAQGKFEIKTGALFCHHASMVDRSIVKIPPRFDLNPGYADLQNAELGETVNGRICSDNGNNFVSDWVMIKNRSGLPYKLVLAVWQGNVGRGGALWIGGIERHEGNFPKVSGPLMFDDVRGPLTEKNNIEIEEELIRKRVESDHMLLSSFFTKYASNMGGM